MRAACGPADLLGHAAGIGERGRVSGLRETERGGVAHERLPYRGPQDGDRDEHQQRRHDAALGARLRREPARHGRRHAERLQRGRHHDPPNRTRVPVADVATSAGTPAARNRASRLAIAAASVRARSSVQCPSAYDCALHGTRRQGRQRRRAAREQRQRIVRRRKALGMPPFRVSARESGARRRRGWRRRPARRRRQRQGQSIRALHATRRSAATPIRRRWRRHAGTSAAPARIERRGKDARRHGRASSAAAERAGRGSRSMAAANAVAGAASQRHGVPRRKSTPVSRCQRASAASANGASTRTCEGGDPLRRACASATASSAGRAPSVDGASTGKALAVLAADEARGAGIARAPGPARRRRARDPARQ